MENFPGNKFTVNQLSIISENNNQVYLNSWHQSSLWTPLLYSTASNSRKKNKNGNFQTKIKIFNRIRTKYTLFRRNQVDESTIKPVWGLICKIAIFFFLYSIKKTKTRSKLYLTQVGALCILAESMHPRMNPPFQSSTTFQHFTHTVACPPQALYSWGRPWAASFKSMNIKHF